MTILRKVAWFVIASCRSLVQILPPQLFSTTLLRVFAPKGARNFYPENVSSMKPVAPIVFRYCTLELAHAAAPPSRFEPAALGCGLVLLCCIFSVRHTQSNCLICLPDKSGNFLAFGAKTRKNNVKSEKTGFGKSIETVPGPVFAFSE